MEPCPHCGFTNRPGAARCECCLSSLAPDATPEASAGASPAPPLDAVSQPAPTPAPELRSQPEWVPPAPLNPEPGQRAALQLPNQPPPIAPTVGEASSKLLIAVVVVGLVGGLWLMRPRPGRGESLAVRLWRTARTDASITRTQRRPYRVLRENDDARLSNETERTVAATEPPVSAGSSPASGQSAFPAAAGPAARQPVAPVSSAPPPAPAQAPAQSLMEEQASSRYEVAVRLLDRKQAGQARTALNDVIRRYPATRAAAQARDLLLQIPDDPVPPSQPRSANRGPLVAENQRPAPPNAQQAPAQPRRDDPIADALAGRQRASAQKPVIPPSLQSSAPATAAPTPYAAGDEARILSAGFQGDSTLVVDVEYTLRSMHGRRVFLGAYMRSESVSGRLGYTFSPMTAGRGNARLTLSGIPANVSQLRLTFFEEGGALFFTRDFVISK